MLECSEQKQTKACRCSWQQLLQTAVRSRQERLQFLVLSDSEEEEKKPAESVLALSDKARNILNCRVQSNPAFNLYYRSKQAI